jgi:hypothetical protein
MSFVANAQFDARHPTALAVYCSDGRFTEAIEELLRSLGHTRLDTVTLPGGPALLNLLRAGFADLDTISRSIAFLVRGHAITDATLLAHQGCGYYRARFTGKSPEEIESEQTADLVHAREALLGRHPALRVRLFYARPTGAAVRFDEV